MGFPKIFPRVLKGYFLGSFVPKGMEVRKFPTKKWVQMVKLTLEPSLIPYPIQLGTSFSPKLTSSPKNKERTLTWVWEGKLKNRWHKFLKS